MNRCIATLSVASVWLLSPVATAQEPGEKQKADKAVIEHCLAVAKKHAAEYEIAPADDRKAVFKLISEPIFRRTQSVRGDDIGAVYVWVDGESRPAVMGVCSLIRAARRLVKPTSSFIPFMPNRLP